jgi:uncharacterized protein (TIGR02246 family)
MATSPQSVIDDFVAAANAGDIDRMMSIYEPGARLAFPGQPAVGHEAIRGALQNLLMQRPSFKGRTVSVSQTRRPGDAAFRMKPDRDRCQGRSVRDVR